MFNFVFDFRMILRTLALSASFLSFFLYHTHALGFDAKFLRELQSSGTVDVINSVLADFVFEAQVDKISQTVLLERLESSNPLSCAQFRINGLALEVDSSLGSTQLNGETYEQLFVTLALTDLQFTCTIPTVTTNLFTNSKTSGSVKVSSTSTDLTLPLSFLSEDFEYLIPIAATVEDTNCDNLINLQISFTFNVGGVAGSLVNLFSGLIEPEIRSSLKTEVCAALLVLAENVTALVTENPLAESTLFNERDSIESNQIPMQTLVETAETKLSVFLVDGLEYFDKEEFSTTANIVVKNFLKAPIIQNFNRTLFSILDFVGNYVESHNLTLGEDFNITTEELETLANLIEELLTEFFGLTVNIPVEELKPLFEDLVQYFIDNVNISDISQIETVLDGIITIVEDFIISFYGDDLTSEQVDIIRNVSAFLISIEFNENFDFNSILDFIETSFGFKIPFDINNSSNIFNQTELGNSTQAFDSIFDFLDNIKISDILPFLPEDEFLVEYLLKFGEDATLLTVFEELLSVLSPVFEDLKAVKFDLNLTLDEIYVPDSVKDLLNYTINNFPLPENITKILVEIINSDSTELSNSIKDFLTFSTEISSVGNITLSFYSISISAEGDVVSFTESGFSGHSSLILPALSFESFNVVFGFIIELDSVSGTKFSDILEITLSGSIFSQLALTFAFDFGQLEDFIFLSADTVEVLLSALLDFAKCFLSSFQFIISAERTVSTFSALLVSKNGTFSGFTEDLISTFVLMYKPALPTFVENFIEETVSNISSSGFYSLYEISDPNFEEFICESYESNSPTLFPTKINTNTKSPTAPNANTKSPGGPSNAGTESSVFGFSVSNLSAIIIKSGIAACALVIASVVGVKLYKRNKSVLNKQEMLPEAKVVSEETHLKKKAQPNQNEVSV